MKSGPFRVRFVICRGCRLTKCPGTGAAPRPCEAPLWADQISLENALYEYQVINNEFLAFIQNILWLGGAYKGLPPTSFGYYYVTGKGQVILSVHAPKRISINYINKPTSLNTLYHNTTSEHLISKSPRASGIYIKCPQDPRPN